MNSVIQQLFLIPGIKEALLSIDDEDSDEDTLFFQFQMVMGHLQVNFSVSSRYRELFKNIYVFYFIFLVGLEVTVLRPRKVLAMPSSPRATR